MAEKVYIEREPQVRCFLGDRDPERVLAFESEVKRAWKFISEDDETRRLDIILSHIGPAVRVELSCRDPESQETASKLLDLIVKVYGESRSSLELLQVLLQQKQASDDLRTYSHRLKRLFDALTRLQLELGEVVQPETTLRDQFIVGLTDLYLKRELKEKVKLLRNLSFAAIRETALEYAQDMGDSSFAAAATVNGIKSTRVDPVTPSYPQWSTEMSNLKATLDSMMTRLTSKQGGSTQAAKANLPPRSENDINQWW